MIQLKSFYSSVDSKNISASLDVINLNQIEVQYSWSKNWLFKMSALATSNVGVRADHLWQTTCFEFFIKEAKSGKYWECNLSPRGDWNVYCFDDYRMPQPPMEYPEGHLVNFNFSQGQLKATVKLPIQLGSCFQISLNAIIEDLVGNKSYWAIQHQNEKPDFHNFENFQMKGNSC